MLQEIRCCGSHRLLAKANAIYIQIVRSAKHLMK
ncbi:Com family DNA-binding transcriptional regulator [Arsenophonus sp. PmNCSU2021_1]